ncbi:MAG: phosphoglucosamine mutase [Proteobacteria bacterium]|nr:phosphoglucosamine mutase [Pseudomonadota bacterium]
MGKLFGTDGVRGEANRYPMDASTAASLGQALTHLLKRASRQPRVIIGKDTRLSGDMLEGALVAGITSMGGNPSPVGVLPSPAIAFITRSVGAEAGIVISASHNPYQDNGIKIFRGDGFKLSEEEEQAIEDLILKGRLPDMTPPAREIGRSYRIGDARDRYVDFLKNSFPSDLSMKGMKVVIDTANGAAYEVAPEVFFQLGADVEVIHNKPDGMNINEQCGSQHTRDLQERVVASHADLGLALDGDGDRLIAVDEKGNTITGDQILIICAKGLQDLGQLKNDLLVSTVMSNLGLKVACTGLGLKHHAAGVGDRYVLAEMQRLGARLGGEDSGHIIFLDHHTTGDGLLAAIQLIAAMLRQGQPLSELATMMEIYPQKLRNVAVKSKPEISTMTDVQEVIREMEKTLGQHGRVLVRYSGTQNLCRVMVEGPTKEVTERCCDRIAETIKETLG